MKQILLLDDDVHYLTKLKQTIENTTEFSVVCFRTAEEAISAIEDAASCFYAFILDIEMTGQPKTGIDVAEKIRRQQRYCLHPIIFLTSHTHYSFGALSHLHYYDFFSKDCDMNLICDSLVKTNTTREPETEIVSKITVHGIHYSVEVNLENVVCIELFGNVLVITDSLGKEQKIKVRPNAFFEICQQVASIPTFEQIHRSVIVNLHKIKTIEWHKNTAMIWLFNVEHAKPVGKTHLEKLSVYKR